MPYKTIQQNFANGELNPKMQGRSDVDMYYKSAQKMRDVATTPYGGYVRRPGFKNINLMKKIFGQIENLNVSTELVEDENNPMSNITDLNFGTYGKASSEGQEKPLGTILARIGAGEASTSFNHYYAWKQKFYAWSYTSSSVYITFYTDKRNPEVRDNYYYKYISTGEIVKYSYFITAVTENTITVTYADSSYTLTFQPGKEITQIYPVYTKEINPESGEGIYTDIADSFLAYASRVENNVLFDEEEHEFVRYIEGDKEFEGTAIKKNVKYYAFSGKNGYCWVSQLTNVYTKERNPDINSKVCEYKGYTLVPNDNSKISAVYKNEATGNIDSIFIGNTRYYFKERTKLNMSVFSTKDTLEKGNDVYSYDDKTIYGKVTNVAEGNITITDKSASNISNVFTRDEAHDIEKEEIEIINQPIETINQSEEKSLKINKIQITNISSAIEQTLCLQVVYPDLTKKDLKVFSTDKNPYDVVMDLEKEENIKYVQIVSTKTQELDISLSGFSLYENKQNTSDIKLFPFVFNNEQAYVICVSEGKIDIYNNDVLEKTVTSSVLKNDYIKNIRFAQTADTAIFVHPEFAPLQLKRGFQEGEWTLSSFALESIPKYNFEIITPINYNFTITPDVLDGTVKLSFNGTISQNVVGQYLEGNGGRVKITQQENKYLIGYTIIGFYTTDAIAANQWTITQNYEPVWSETRGWPNSVVFHQGRLWFGGSKSRPQTVWGSKVGLFGKFDPTSGYDDDAVEFTLDTNTLNKITDLYSQRNLMIFTLGGEFICQTSYSEPITPNNVNALKQTANGSWPLTSPIDIEGQVIFIDRRGQALINFVYDSNQDAYSSINGALLNSHLISEPVDLDVERNNLTQQTNYVYIVNKDGTLCVVNLLAAQGITGGFTLWDMNGKVRSVCVLPDATYIAIERSELNGNNIYLEKLDWNTLTDNAEIISVSDQSQFAYERFANKKVDVILDGKFFGQYTVNSEGLLDLAQNINGKMEIGLPFRSYVQSNFLELPNMGGGIGKRKRLATMTVRVIDTPELTINGETRLLKGKGIEDVNLYAVGDWSIKPTWEFTQNKPYKFNVLAMQMNVNYEVAND